MTNILLIILATIGVLTLASCAVIGIAVFLDWIKDVYQYRSNASYQAGQEHRSQRLENDAWWFSEDETTCDLLLNLAKGMRVSEAREIWRQKRKEEAEKAAGAI